MMISKLSKYSVIPSSIFPLAVVAVIGYIAYKKFVKKDM